MIDVVDRFDTEDAQQGVRGFVEDRDEPAEQGQIDRGRAGEPGGERLGAGDGQVLREQFAEEHLDERRDEQGEDGADEDACAGGDRGASQGFADGCADERFGDVADEQTGDGDAQLRAGEHEGGAAGDGQGSVRGAITGGRTSGQTGAVDGHIGEFLRHEVAGGHRNEEDDEEATRSESSQVNGDHLPARSVLAKRLPARY